MTKSWAGESFTNRENDGFRSLLRKWRALASNSIWQSAKAQDCSWWYGERASVSQLAGAAWALRGWAMQDYAWTRRKEGQRRAAYAQIDLCVEQRKRKLRFIAEAKQVWPQLDRPTTVSKLVEHAFQRLRCELDAVEPDSWHRKRFVFVAPWYEAKRVPLSESSITAFIDELRKIRGASVWTFPVWARRCVLPSWSPPMHYPGVALIVRSMAPDR